MENNIPTPNTRAQAKTRPSILQWNCNSLRRRHDDLYARVLHQPYDILCLQETDTLPEECRLPGYVAYHCATKCAEPHCPLKRCDNTAHAPGRTRAAIYIKKSIPHARVDLGGPRSDHLECVAVTTRMGKTETTVVSAYVPPNRDWDPAELCSLTALCTRDKIVCGDLNAHHASWGSRRANKRGTQLVDAITTCGLAPINTGETTFVKRNNRKSCIDVAFTSEHLRYSWRPQASTWGSDHKPIVMEPESGGAARGRVFSVTHWDRFRELLSEHQQDDFLGALERSLKAATTTAHAAPFQPAPDLKLLNLRAARQRAQRQALRSGARDEWTLYWL